MFHLVFHEPKIPPNTGNAIRMSAVTGCTLHLVEPLGFEMSDARLRRAGLDYHDLAHVVIHPDMETTWRWLAEHGSGRTFAFTTHTTTSFADVAYRPGDALLLGTEPSGLPAQVLQDPRVTAAVRIPMLAGVRSLNLASSAAIAVYEAWRQHGYAGSADATGPPA